MKKKLLIIKSVPKTLTLLHVLELIVLVAVAIQLTILGINSLRKDSPVLGLRFEGHVIGFLDSHNHDIRGQVEAILNAHETNQLTIKVGTMTSTITLRQLGEHADRQKVYQDLLKAGRIGSIGSRLVDQDLAIMGIRNIKLAHAGFSDQLAKAYLASLDKKIDVAPVNAGFVFERQKLILKPDIHGKAVNIDAALQELRGADPEQGTFLSLPIKSVTATITSTLLQPLLPQVVRITSKPLTIKAAQSHIMLSSEQLASLVIPKAVLDQKDKRTVVGQIGFDEAALSSAIESVIAQARIAPEPQVMNGATIVHAGKIGLQPKDNQALVSVLATLSARQTGAGSPEIVDIPMVSVEPPVIQQMANAARVRTGTGLVRLTFDDGPGAHTEQILDILKRYNVHATFYVIGRNIGAHASTLQRIHAEGHSIGNHSFSHADLTRLSRAAVVSELANTQAAVQQACGVTPTSFRPPYGMQNSTVREVAASLGLYVDLWSVDPRDWTQPGSNVITQRVLASDGPGAVVILHVLYQQTVDALPFIIEGIRAQGYTLE